MFALMVVLASASLSPGFQLNRRPINPSPHGTQASGLAGNYYGYDGRTLHTWEFHGDGTFLHTWIASGAGTRVRNSERGGFRVQGDSLELRLTSSATGFTTPGTGGNSTLVGGNAETASQIRHLKIQFDTAGKPAVLEGIQLKPKSW
jgi:hypothetical protein